MASASDHTLPALCELLAVLGRDNAFYRHKLPGAGWQPGSLAEFCAQVPFTTKAELVADQAAHPPYGSNLTFPLTDYTRCHQTSGTTGSPLRWLDTPQSWNAMIDDWAEVLRAAGVGRGDRAMFAFSFGPFLGFWLAFEAAQKLGCLCFAGGGMSSVLRARVLIENECTVLCCTPTYALHLAEVARAEALDLSRLKLRTILVAGEPGGSLPAVRDRLAMAWSGVRVFDHHGMTETGPVTHEHPDRPGTLVVMERSFFAEVIDPQTGVAVPEGRPGELVLTTLRRMASPLVRYRTGDLVCARRLAAIDSDAAARPGPLILEGGILGRVDEMVIIRGVNVYPTAIEALVHAVPGIGEFRVTHDTRPALPELTLEVEATAAAAHELEHRLQTALALRVPVAAVAPGTLPRFELKARRWRRLA